MDRIRGLKFPVPERIRGVNFFESAESCQDGRIVRWGFGYVCIVMVKRHRYLLVALDVSTNHG